MILPDGDRAEALGGQHCHHLWRILTSGCSDFFAALYIYVHIFHIFPPSLRGFCLQFNARSCRGSSPLTGNAKWSRWEPRTCCAFLNWSWVTSTVCRSKTRGCQTHLTSAHNGTQVHPIAHPSADGATSDCISRPCHSVFYWPPLALCEHNDFPLLSLRIEFRSLELSCFIFPPTPTSQSTNWHVLWLTNYVICHGVLFSEAFPWFTLQLFNPITKLEELPP